MTKGVASFAPGALMMLSALLQVCSRQLGLLSSAGCGSLLVNGAARAKKKQKTPMMIKKTLLGS